MTLNEAKEDVLNRLKDTLDCYKVDQPTEGFKRLTMLFIDLTIASTCCLPTEERADFIAGLITSIMLDVSSAVRSIERMMEKETPTKPQMVIKMNAQYKS